MRSINVWRWPYFLAFLGAACGSLILFAWPSWKDPEASRGVWDAGVLLARVAWCGAVGYVARVIEGFLCENSTNASSSSPS